MRAAEQPRRKRISSAAPDVPPVRGRQAVSRVANRVRSLALRVFAIHGLLLILLVLIGVFSLLRPHTFPTAFNLRSILTDQPVTVLAALAVMIPLATNQFDLSVGYMIGLTHILTVGLQTQSGLPWQVAALVALAVGAGVGLVNGLLVTRAHIDSFVATLGTGTVIFGISNWYTGGQELVGSTSPGFSSIAQTVGGIPKTAIYAVVVTVVIWFVLEYLPLGRRLYVLGANPRAAELTGISERRYIPLAFVASGVLAALAGVILGTNLNVGNPAVGPEYLLPAFAGALLGATSVRPGRVNAWGTVLAVMILAVAFSGLQQLGAAFYVAYLFNGSVLIVAVSLAVYAARVRKSRATALQEGFSAVHAPHEDSAPAEVDP